MEIKRFYKESSVEEKNQFLSKILKPRQSIDALSLPYGVSIFQENVQLVFILLCQILGMDNDKYVISVMLWCLVKVFQSESIPIFLKIDEFLAEAIHAQLVNLHLFR